MGIVKENGTGIANANSYVDINDILNYAELRGFTFADENLIEPLTILAMDFIESNRDQFQGTKVSAIQPLQFPRVGVYIDQVEFPSNSIPVDLKNAVCQAVIDIQTVNPFPVLDGYAVRRQKTDVIETEFATGGGLASAAFPVRPTFTKVQMLLSPLLTSNGRGVLSLVRI